MDPHAPWCLPVKVAEELQEKYNAMQLQVVISGDLDTFIRGQIILRV